MSTFQQKRNSGTKFELELSTVISKYTKHIWRNIRFATRLTANGTTEIDILFCYKDIVFIVEAKNTSSIFGDYDAKNWSFVGSQAVFKNTKEYSALNIIVQNNIHVSSFKDCFYAYFREWPVVIPVIVVPNDCVVSPDIADSIFTVGQLDNFLAQANEWSTLSALHRRVSSLLLGDGCVVTRPDF